MVTFPSPAKLGSQRVLFLVLLPWTCCVAMMRQHIATPVQSNAAAIHLLSYEYLNPRSAFKLVLMERGPDDYSTCYLPT